MNIKIINNTTIRFNNLKGTLVSEKEKYKLQNPNDLQWAILYSSMFTFNIYEYDSIYYLDNNIGDGTYLFIKKNKYRLIVFGHGLPIIKDETGELNYIK
jgi:hypothetical protein